MIEQEIKITYNYCAAFVRNTKGKCQHVIKPKQNKNNSVLYRNKEIVLQ